MIAETELAILGNDDPLEERDDMAVSGRVHCRPTGCASSRQTCPPCTAATARWANLGQKLGEMMGKPGKYQEEESP